MNLLSLGNIISHLGKIAGDVSKTKSAVEDIVVKFELVKNDARVTQFLDANPDIKSAFADMSADVRTAQNAIKDLTSLTK